MWRCRKRREDETKSLKLPMLFPMWVVPVRTLLAMSGPVKSFQELRAEGSVVEWAPGMFCVFCSHQWLGRKKADPEGKQLKVLQEALRNIISGSLKVQTGLPYLFANGEVKRLSPEEISELERGFIWFDWMSIPQITMRTSDGDDVGSDMKKAVDSIPAYVEASRIFLVLCPTERHSERDQLCGFTSWAKRGWCRVEMAAAVLTKKKPQPMVVVRSGVQAELMFCTSYLHAMPGQGDFSVETDREAVYSVMDSCLQSSLSELWLDVNQSPQKLAQARLMTALRGHFLDGLGSSAQKAATEAEAHEDLSSFLRKFGFTGLQRREELGPVCCAAASANMQVLTELVTSRADVNERVPRRSVVRAMLLSGGMTPLHIVCQYHGQPEVAQCLLALRADLKARNLDGFNALHIAAMAGNKRCIDVLLSAGMDIDEAGGPGITALMVGNYFGQPSSVQLLLERRARVDHQLIGINALINSVEGASEACLQLLLEHRADVNTIVEPHSAAARATWGAIRFGGMLMGQGSIAGKLSLYAGTSALGVAAILGNAEQVWLLLAARADATSRNWRGQDALELAKLEDHPAVVTLLQAQTSKGSPTFSVEV